MQKGDVPKFEKWSEEEKVAALYAWYGKMQGMDDTIQVLQCCLKDAAKANRELLRRNDDDDWK